MKKIQTERFTAEPSSLKSEMMNILVKLMEKTGVLTVAGGDADWRRMAAGFPFPLFLSGVSDPELENYDFPVR